MLDELLLTNHIIMFDTRRMQNQIASWFGKGDGLKLLFRISFLSRPWDPWEEKVMIKH